MPHHHLVIAVALIVPVALLFFPGLGLVELVLWVVVAGLVAGLIDLDIIVIVAIRAREDERLRPYTSMGNVAKDFKGFMRTIAETGVLRTGLVTHVTVTIVLLLLTYLLASRLMVPMTIGALSHLATDLPHVKKLFGT